MSFCLSTLCAILGPVLSLMRTEASVPQRLMVETRTVLESFDFGIDTIDLYTLLPTTIILRNDSSKSILEALVLNGFLATSPVNPSLAISFKMLELLRRLRLRKPSFSIESFTCVVCDYYVVCTVTPEFLPAE